MTEDIGLCVSSAVCTHPGHLGGAPASETPDNPMPQEGLQSCIHAVGVLYSHTKTIGLILDLEMREKVRLDGTWTARSCENLIVQPGLCLRLIRVIILCGEVGQEDRPKAVVWTWEERAVTVEAGKGWASGHLYG